MTDYYQTLGVHRGANQDEIKQAFRRMAAQHHPDRGGDTATFQEVQAAYATLAIQKSGNNTIILSHSLEEVGSTLVEVFLQDLKISLLRHSDTAATLSLAKVLDNRKEIEI